LPISDRRALVVSELCRQPFPLTPMAECDLHPLICFQNQATSLPLAEVSAISLENLAMSAIGTVNEENSPFVMFSDKGHYAEVMFSGMRL
jgi:hypothetical protein